MSVQNSMSVATLRLMNPVYPHLQVRYQYYARKADGEIGLDDYDCALVQRSGDSMRWWDGANTTTSNSGANCPS